LPPSVASARPGNRGGYPRTSCTLPACHGNASNQNIQLTEQHMQSRKISDICVRRVTFPLRVPSLLYVGYDHIFTLTIVIGLITNMTPVNYQHHPITEHIVDSHCT